MNWKIYLSAALFAGGVVFSVFFLKHTMNNALVRIIASVSAIALTAALYAFIYTDAGLYERTSGDALTTEWTPNRNYISKGFIYPLIYGIKATIEDMRGNYPDWYNEQDARAAFEAFSDADIPEGKKIGLICITLEAYSDLSRFGVLDFIEDVYGPFHDLQAQSVAGTLVCNVFAGATIDTERLFLTGYTHLTPYRTATNSYVHYLKSQGYYTEGLHAGDMWFYDRRPVNSNLGFDAYYFIDDYEGANRDDAFFFPAVLDLYKARDAGKPYFSYNLSYQNHGAYDSGRTKEP